MRRLALAAALLACKSSPQAPASGTTARPASPLVRAPDTTDDRDADRDADRVPDARDGCPDEPEDVDAFEDEDGCVDRDNDRDGVPDAYEWIDGRWTNCDRRIKNGNETDCRNLPEDLDGEWDHDGCPDVMCIDSCQVKLAERLRLDRRGRPLPGSDAILDAVAETLRAAPDIELYVEAHVDAQRDASAAVRATGRTAEAVVEALVGRGIDRARLTPLGWGHEKPIDRNTTEDGRANNRRVEFVQRDGCGCEDRPAGRADARPAWDCR
ncbi:OmpA family protein [Nannocystis pusilla]|uniref:OmpA family protein n=1 Tax=Nannocystis pusilla TaxID=889268 RepID=A0A9X3F3M3_9BACT|nr:OmpA family protein [Nannocystis pusilla]